MKKENKLNAGLSDRLNTLINTRDMSKADMARIANVTPQAVNNWFKRGEIGKDSAIKIALHAGVSVNWLLGESMSNLDIIHNVKLSPTEKEGKLIGLFRKLTDQEKDYVVSFIEWRVEQLDKLYAELKALKKDS